MGIHQVIYYCELLTMVFFIVALVRLRRANRSILDLKDLPLAVEGTGPKISVVVAARNEERNLNRGLSSLLQQDYKNLEIIAVDDRSTDGTASILDQLRTNAPQLKVFHLHQLPPGWLGKTHALYYGAGHTSGEYLLFADADIVMEPTTISRAIRYALDHNRDHIAVVPRLDMKGLLLNLYAGSFPLFFSMFVKPWKAKDPKSKCFVGIGAFNLIRKSAYEKIGTFKAIAMRPDDDLKLGKLVKKNGFSQELLLGPTLLSVEWYSSFKDLIDGMTRNAFAAIDYKTFMVPIYSLAMIWLYLFPFVGIVTTHGLNPIVNVFNATLLICMAMTTGIRYGVKPWYPLALPIASVIHLYVFLNSTWKTLKNKGIDWRDTHYDLKELKANQV